MDNIRLISIIITVYNTSEYLPRCLDSILNQDNGLLEIILVNDGSTDNSLEICEAYAKKHPCIRVVSQKNQGVSAARNAGLKQAEGIYVWYVDSDDWIASGGIVLLKHVIEKNDPDAIQIMYSRKSELSEHDNQELKSDTYFELNNREIWEAFVSEKLMSYTGCLLAKKELYESGNITFPEGRYFEDTATIFKIFSEAQKLCIVPEKIYNYCYREGSITNIIVGRKLLALYESVVEELDGVGKICNKHKIKAYKFFELNCYVQMLVFFYKAWLDCQEDCNYNSYIDELKTKIGKFNLTISDLLQYRKYSMFRHYILYRLGLMVPVLRFSKRRLK